MAGRIPQNFIDELVSRIDIVDLIGSRIPLKKGGKDYQACCPFHQEKTPSFTVSRDKQFYHCFGCGAHGTAIGFLIDYDHLSFVEAVEELAHQAGVDVPREGGDSHAPDYRPLYETLEQAARFYAQQLRQHPQAQRAVDYLKGRGVSGEIAATFGIGYAPAGWDHVLRQLGRDADGQERLRTTGLLAEADGRCYDRFRDRIMFPIRDHRGRTIGFGGRVLDASKPKYLNSPETPLFHKGQALYGLYEAQQALGRIERLLVVEGYLDVVALAQHGIRYAVATLGTATTPEHLERIFRTTAQVLFCFDGDRAGREAGWKALVTALPFMREGREIRFLFLPEGEDPDTLVRQEGATAFEQRLAAATPMSSFLFERLAEQTDMSSLDGRARMAEQARPLLAKLPPGIFRDMMYDRLGKLIELNPVQLRDHAPPPDRPRARPAKPQGQQAMTPARMAIALLLQHPELAQTAELSDEWRRLEVPGVGLLADILDILRTQPALSTAALTERWRDREEWRHLQKLAAAQLPVPPEGYAAEFHGALARLTEQFHDQETARLLEQAKRQRLTAEEKQRLNRLLARRASPPATGAP